MRCGSLDNSCRCKVNTVLKNTYLQPRIQATFSGSESAMDGRFTPICIECGSLDNPCRCKIVGPTLAFIGFVVAAVIEYPIGAFTWCCNRNLGRRIMAHPAMVVYPTINSCIPI